MSLGVIIGLWSVLFITDYIMYKNDSPLLFVTTTINDINGEHIITESGLGYYVIENEQNIAELYLFGHKIK